MSTAAVDAASGSASPSSCCVVCKSPNARSCSRCKQVYYCGADHQKADWPSHKANCKSPQDRKLEEERKAKESKESKDGSGKKVVKKVVRKPAIVDENDDDIDAEFNTSFAQPTAKKAEEKKEEVPIRFEGMGVQQLIYVIRTRKDKKDVMGQAFSTLTNLIGAEGDNRVRFVQMGGMPPFIDAVNANIAEPRVMEQACAAIANLVVGNENKLKLAEMGIVHLVAQIMRKHPQDAETLEHACAAIWNLAVHPELQVKIRYEGGVDIVVTTLTYHHDHAKLAERACAALWNLSNNADNAALIAKCGGLHGYINVLESHPNNDGVVARACGAMSALPPSHFKVKKVVPASMKYIVAAYRTHIANAGVMEYACKAVSLLTLHPESCVSMVKQGMIPLILQAIKIHAMISNIIIPCTIALHNLCTQCQSKDLNIEHAKLINMNQSNNGTYSNDGIEILIESNAKSYNGQFEIFDALYKTLLGLLAYEPNKDVILKKGGMEVLCTGLKAHADRPSLIESAMQTITALTHTAAEQKDDRRERVEKAFYHDGVLGFCSGGGIIAYSSAMKAICNNVTSDSSPSVSSLTTKLVQKLVHFVFNIYQYYSQNVNAQHAALILMRISFARSVLMEGLVVAMKSNFHYKSNIIMNDSLSLLLYLSEKCTIDDVTMIGRLGVLDFIVEVSKNGNNVYSEDYRDMSDMILLGIMGNRKLNIMSHLVGYGHLSHFIASLVPILRSDIRNVELMTDGTKILFYLSKNKENQTAILKGDGLSLLFDAIDQHGQSVSSITFSCTQAIINCLMNPSAPTDLPQSKYSELTNKMKTIINPLCEKKLNDEVWDSVEKRRERRECIVKLNEWRKANGEEEMAIPPEPKEEDRKKEEEEKKAKESEEKEKSKETESPFGSKSNPLFEKASYPSKPLSKDGPQIEVLDD